MIINKRGDIPYLLGLIFLLAGVIYFFASNWPMLDRPVKIGLSVALILVSYIASALYKRSSTFKYLSNWWLLAAAIAFGISLALVGQMYNSHADSYVLFFIWLIPVLLLAILTKYEPFYWLSLLLFELTIWQKLYPTGIWVTYNDWEEFSIYTSLIVLHLGLFVWLKKLSREKLAFITLMIAQYCAVFLLNKYSLYHVFSEFRSTSLAFLLLHVVYTVLIVLFWRKFERERKNHPVEMAVQLLFFGFYVVYNVFFIFLIMFGEALFYVGFLLLIALFGFSIYFLQKLKKNAQETDQKWARYTYQFFVGILSFLGTIVALASFSSFIFLAFGFMEGMKYAYLFLGMVCITVGLVLKKKSFIVVRLTLQITGIICLFSFAFMMNETWTLWLITIALAIMTASLFQKKEALLYYFALNIGLVAAIRMTINDYALSRELLPASLLVLGLLNAAIFFIAKKEDLGLLSYLLSLIYFLYITFSDNLSIIFTVMYHLVFIVYLTIHLFHPKSESRVYRSFTWMALSVFLIWKYYEYVWDLLHKSLALFILSAIFFLIFFVWGQKHTEKARNILEWSQKPVLVILLLQLAFIGFTSWQKEQLLQNGQLVALKLEPLDPRSLLQGDYVQLNYEMHTKFLDQPDSLEGKVHIILEKSADNVQVNGKQVPIYKPKTFVSANQPAVVNEEKVILQGKARYGTLDLGIEHFFIPENTGQKWENKNYALVRVADNGDAILETLVKK
ncbi:GDYXXLXY domain-containing protein [Bacillus sp. REN10]|uniref:GDYXXLXY domain-containing protein n=1 Tax=Bacillus sp. REN10 TaxID=2782541 RepID=UPI00193BD177|nr:GDYXXLXY domain-containing protein [Bacillus sp. REN10]